MREARGSMATTQENVADVQEVVKHHILIVDDEEENLDLLESTLRRGNVLFKAASGEEAKTIIESETVQMVITDQRMPGISGTQLLEYLREKDDRIIRILITGYADMKVAVEAINKGGVHRYINKPWDPGELRKIVAAELARFDLEERNKQLTEALMRQNEELERKKSEIERLAMEYKRAKRGRRRDERQARAFERRPAQSAGRNQAPERQARSRQQKARAPVHHRQPHRLLQQAVHASTPRKRTRPRQALQQEPVADDGGPRQIQARQRLLRPSLRRRGAQKRDRHHSEKNIRETDWPTRYGGDEFIIILPHIGVDRAHYLAKRIHADIRALHLPAPTGEPFVPTVSVGIAYFPMEGRKKSPRKSSSRRPTKRSTRPRKAAAIGL
ncbi:MAG: response regulator [Deltaproteobacteria bacterium]|nr:response regulator [Deltaproteobacteria bacterium]